MVQSLADIRSFVERVRYEANDFKFNNGFTIPTHVLAKRVADLAQIATQEASFRARAVVTLLVGVDDDKGAQLFKIDPAGQYLPYKAVAAGKLEAEALNYLEKHVAEIPTLTVNETIELAISSMQYILSTDFKGSEIEIGVVSKDKSFRVLTLEEIEERLTVITEKADA